MSAFASIHRSYLGSETLTRAHSGTTLTGRIRLFRTPWTAGLTPFRSTAWADNCKWNALKATKCKVGMCGGDSMRGRGSHQGQPGQSPINRIPARILGIFVSMRTHERGCVVRPRASDAEEDLIRRSWWFSFATCARTRERSTGCRTSPSRCSSATTARTCSRNVSASAREFSEQSSVGLRRSGNEHGGCRASESGRPPGWRSGGSYCHLFRGGRSRNRETSLVGSGLGGRAGRRNSRGAAETPVGPTHSAAARWGFGGLGSSGVAARPASVKADPPNGRGSPEPSASALPESLVSAGGAYR